MNTHHANINYDNKTKKIDQDFYSHYYLNLKACHCVANKLLTEKVIHN